MNEQPVVKRGPGRPRKHPLPETKVEPKDEPKGLKMRAKPNWETLDYAEETPDRLHIPRELFPEGMDLQWITHTVLGQDFSRFRGHAEQRGWTVVHNDDFDGRFDGRFMKKGSKEEINVDGLVLMARPLELSLRAKREDYKRAREQVNIKEQALRGGDLPSVTLDTQHESALRSNRINKTIERITIPTDK